MIIEGRPFRLSGAFVRDVRDQDQNRLVLERANRLYEQLLGDEREQVGRWLGQFEAVLGRQDGREIGEARKQFAAALDMLERGPTW